MVGVCDSEASVRRVGLLRGLALKAGWRRMLPAGGSWTGVVCVVGSTLRTLLRNEQPT